MNDITTEDNYMKDAQGRLVPKTAVKVTDQLRDELVKTLVDAAKVEQEGMRFFKAGVFEQVTGFVSLVFEEHGVKYGGKKGNISLVSYDGCSKVEISVQDRIRFDESLQVAKDIIDDLIVKWSEGGNDNLKAIVMDAFRVDQEGNISVPRLLSLRRLEMDDPDGEWQKAMDIMSDSIVTEGSKEYVRFYDRATPKDQWEAIPLDIAKLTIKKD